MVWGSVVGLQRRVSGAIRKTRRRLCIRKPYRNAPFSLCRRVCRVSLKGVRGVEVKAGVGDTKSAFQNLGMVYNFC
jgi:hypothetical protein